MNFLQSLLEKEHHVSPQGKRAGGTQQWSGYIQRDSNYQFPTGSCFYPKNPGSSCFYQKTLWSLAHEPYSCFVIPWQSGAGERWQTGNKAGGRIFLWELHQDQRPFLVWLAGVVSRKGTLCAQEVGQRTPQPPVHPCPAWADRNVHQDSFSPSAVTGRWQAGYRQPGCDFIHCFVSQCQSAVFHIIPGPQLQLGEKSSACSTGWGCCNLLALPVSSLPLLAPEISFPTDAFHAGMWIWFLVFVTILFKPTLPQVWITCCVPKFLCLYLTQL